MRIKTKLSLGTGFLFFVILLFGVLSLATIYRLKKDAGLILKNNYETLVYSNVMLDALDRTSSDKTAAMIFEQNLRKQQSNITEQGETELTAELKKNFETLQLSAGKDSVKKLMRQHLHKIIEINQDAIFRKNSAAAATAESANNWLMIIFSVLILVTFTMTVNFPYLISEPIISLNEGIRSIVNKNYNKRIHVNHNDEFGELAEAFNTMAAKLNEYEHSNLALLTFEKSRIETIINQMKDGIIGLDEEQNILFLNVVAQKLLGLKETDVIDKYAVDVAVSNDLMRKLLQEQSGKKELKIYHGDQESYFQLEKLSVSHNKRALGEVVILRDVTDFHRLDEAKTNHIAMVVHELRVPIAAIKTHVSLMDSERMGAMNRDQKDLIRDMSDDIDRLLQLTIKLQPAGKSEPGPLKR